ncbi:hypothetical protein Goklo_009076 [Gossypium klotzschianum]|uniref:RNase H type-1 domain-containing protein n=1 Tax=Gossypium klotzschianum TaxID=34286 RepID=A0A7J8V2B5_9ROSI|nr:hypothetical protein [Gossypium klotzschianum]
MDGSIRIEEGFTTAEGLVRDHNGGWIIGFCRYLRNCTVTKVELWGILDGLKLILDGRFKEMVLLETLILLSQERSSNPENGKAMKDSTYLPRR